MENIFWTRPNNQQRHPSWRAKPAQSSQQLETLCQRQRPFHFSGSGSKATLRKYIYKIPLSHRMGIVSQKMWHVEQRINLFTPPTCVWILDLWMSSSGFLKHINLSKVYLYSIFISNLGLFGFSWFLSISRSQSVSMRQLVFLTLIRRSLLSWQKVIWLRTAGRFPWCPVTLNQSIKVRNFRQICQTIQNLCARPPLCWNTQPLF